MNVCSSSESIWYISHLLIIQAEWAKISWLSYRRVCPALISRRRFVNGAITLKTKLREWPRFCPYLEKETASFVHLSFANGAPLGGFAGEKTSCILYILSWPLKKQWQLGLFLKHPFIISKDKSWLFCASIESIHHYHYHDYLSQCENKANYFLPNVLMLQYCIFPTILVYPCGSCGLFKEPSFGFLVNPPSWMAQLREF